MIRNTGYTTIWPTPPSPFSLLRLGMDWFLLLVTFSLFSRWGVLCSVLPEQVVCSCVRNTSHTDTAIAILCHTVLHCSYTCILYPFDKLFQIHLCFCHTKVLNKRIEYVSGNHRNKLGVYCYQCWTAEKNLTSIMFWSNQKIWHTR